jgi:molybdate transport system regulatory protein
MPDKATGWSLKVRVWVERDGQKVLGPGRVELLELIDRKKSISAAAREMGMSYRRAWELVQAMNLVAGVSLVEASPGGAKGGGATVTPEGRRAIRLYHRLVARFAQVASKATLADNPLTASPDGG